MSDDHPIILFGAFDRHNFGDLLFPHIVAALLEQKKLDNLIFAGLAERDLRSHGGHRVHVLAQLARQWQDRPVDLIHVGGELLACDAWEAAVMLQSPDAAQQAIARFVASAHDSMEWAQRTLELDALAPYLASRELFPAARQVIFNAVGGAELDRRDPALRAEVLAKLGAADAVGVRDRRTHALLGAAGIAARLLPDPVVMVAELFGGRIRERQQQGEVLRIRRAFPQGYIAFQCSADFGEAAQVIAAQLDRIAQTSGLGIVLFRAGAAPWHDDLDCYRRIAAHMQAAATIFSSLDLWDICALVAGSRAYAGSSLHGRIVAAAFALPRINLRHSWQAPGKQDAYAASWDECAGPATVTTEELAGGIEHAMAAAPALRHEAAADLAMRYRQGFDALCAGLRETCG